MSSRQNSIVVSGAREHNLKDVTVELPRDSLVVITGLSGSGKSSLAFDTIYAEGQRRYVESLSAYARQFLGQMDKPDVDSIEGLSPAISIDQKTTSRNPRSTVGTVTEIYDYLRLLWARIGKPHCFNCGRPIAAQSAEQIIDQIMGMEEGTRFMVMAPIVRGRKGEYGKQLAELRSEGFTRVKVDGELRQLEEEIVLDKKFKHDISVVVDRLVMRPDLRKRLADSVETAVALADGILEVETVPREGEPEIHTYSERFACLHCGISMPELEPRSFSFNAPHGACPRCTGLGSMMEIDPELVVPDPSLSINEGAILPWSSGANSSYEQITQAIAERYEVDVDAPWEELSDDIHNLFLYGTNGEKLYVSYRNRMGRKRSYMTTFEGIVPNLERRYKETDSDWSREKIEEYMSMRPCPECKGARLRPESRAVKVGGLPIHEFTAMSAKRAIEWLDGLDLSSQDRAIARLILREIDERLRFLDNVGVGYLSMERASATLSGGEAQRIRLATQIGSSLVGVLYILDEPSIGLHQRDNERLIATLERLRDLGNTVLVVEHDEGTMRAADYVVDMGPGAGEHGGHVVAKGTAEEIMRVEHSLTGQFLSGTRRIEAPGARRKPTGYVEIVGASQNNLKNVNVKVPLGVFCAVTGVSGSGKSTLINEILYKAVANKLNRARMRPGAHKTIKGLEHLDKIIQVDQSPIGRTPRSNPATYIGLFDQIRDLYSKTQESRARGYKAGRFSFNVKGGRCEVCKGDGQIKIEMHFLPDIYVPCEQCHGKRYNRETLDIRFKGKTIADVLDMPVEEALEFFAHIPKLKRRLQTLHDVGLDYMRLGQPATTLSGGEAQRVKLASELAKVATGRTLYILDEPTTGLHFADIQKLLEVLQTLVDAGNSVVVIEHNLDVIKTADRLIDMGPEGGEEGGTLMAAGTPEDVAAVEESHTGRFLRDLTPPAPKPKRKPRARKVPAAA
ncbi:excinuclease ABC subunit UvrA [Solirubrobacter sp. CPCC 204708]|uniref:UvrABC system protein A n=1 Tax=Solirubrobacter deserti TaxID=2282478 RepID=A0ABT4RT43_9ACTN|nr:excinuclease ABC subunit UvrA [Solirubrobacter deserti]MBE2316367.1 excinuclease ABC subunit UvrA [Solirubrobacter deserti]MDA0141553.1 excinuclease ABC subunit UvrA [Solirubrobacter deserti]